MIAVAPGPLLSPLTRRLQKLEAAFLRPYRGQIGISLAAMLLQSLLLLPLPILQGSVIDWLVKLSRGDRKPDSLAPFFACAVAIPLACLLGRLALGWFSSGQMNRISLQFVRALTDSLHRKLQRLPLAYFDGQETGQLMARLTNDVGTLLIFLSASSLQLMADLVLALGIVIGLFLLSWPLPIVSLRVLPLFFWNHRRHSTSIWKLSRSVQEQTAGLYALV